MILFFILVGRISLLCIQITLKQLLLIIPLFMKVFITL